MLEKQRATPTLDNMSLHHLKDDSSPSSSRTENAFDNKKKNNNNNVETNVNPRWKPFFRRRNVQVVGAVKGKGRSSSKNPENDSKNTILQEVSKGTEEPSPTICLSSFHRCLLEHVLLHPGTCPPTPILQSKLEQDYDSSRLKHDSMLSLSFQEKRAAATGSSDLAPHLLAAHDILQQFLDLYHEVANQTTLPVVADTTTPTTCARDCAEIEVLSPKRRHDVFQIVQEFLRPRIMGSLESMTPEQAAQHLTWLEQWLDRIETTYPELSCAEWRRLDVERLFSQYLQAAIRLSFKELLVPSSSSASSSLSASSSSPSSSMEAIMGDVQRNTAGHAVSSQPERIVAWIQKQLVAAQDLLPGRYTLQVLSACYREISTRMVAELMWQIGTSWQTIHSARYCAIINDAMRLVDLLEDRDWMEEYALDDDNKQLKQDTDAIFQELKELSMHAVSFLGQRIVHDLKDENNILTSVGSAEWALDDSSGVVADCTAATLNDYFCDIQAWLAYGNVFPRILKSCFDLVLQTYVESFFANTMAAGVKDDPALVAKALERDYRGLNTFFHGDTYANSCFGQRHLYSDKERDTRLSIIHSISLVMNPYMKPSDLSNDVSKILRAFGPNGPPAVLYLAGLRQKRTKYNGSHDHYHQEDSIEWIRAIARATRAVDSDDDNAEPCQVVSYNYYKLPDLRNAKQIRNLVFDMKEMNRRISQRSIRTARETSKLLKAPPPYIGLLVAQQQFASRMRNVKNVFIKSH